MAVKGNVELRRRLQEITDQYVGYEVPTRYGSTVKYYRRPGLVQVLRAYSEFVGAA